MTRLPKLVDSRMGQTFTLIVKIQQSRIELENIPPGFCQVVEGIATRRVGEKTSSVWARERAGSMRRWILRAGSSCKSTTVFPTRPSTNCSNGSDTTYQSGSKMNCRTESPCQKVDPRVSFADCETDFSNKVTKLGCHMNVIVMILTLNN